MTCPFCNESDFDLIGLKIHIALGWCDVYEAIDIHRELDRERKAATPPQGTDAS